jgi:sortase A
MAGVSRYRLAHIASVVLITAGVVALVDVGLTLIWQEPMSAAYANWQQARASDQLAELEDEFPNARDLAAVRDEHTEVDRAHALADRFERQIHNDEPIGRMKIDRMNLNIVLFQGTDTATLQRGPGHYPQTPLPGQGGTIGIAGHRTTYLAPFRHINDLRKGDEVHVSMPYGNFTYTVLYHRVVLPTEVDIVDRVGFEQLVMTACHPLYSASHRYAIFARLTSIDGVAR